MTIVVDWDVKKQNKQFTLNMLNSQNTGIIIYFTMDSLLQLLLMNDLMTIRCIMMLNYFYTLYMFCFASSLKYFVHLFKVHVYSSVSAPVLAFGKQKGARIH